MHCKCYMKIREIITEDVELREFLRPKSIIDKIIAKISPIINSQVARCSVDQLIQTVEASKNKLLTNMMKLEREWVNQNVHHDTSQYPVPEITEATANTNPIFIQQFVEPMISSALTLNASLKRLQSLGATERLPYPENIYKHVLINANKYAYRYADTKKPILSKLPKIVD